MASRSKPRRIGAVWLRCGDVRLADNPALHAAVAACDEVLVCFCWCPHEEGQSGGRGAEELLQDWSLEGTALQLLLGEALVELDRELQRQYGSRLLMLGAGASAGAAGPQPGAAELLLGLLQARAAQEQGGAKAQLAVFCNRRVEPWERPREAELSARARDAGAEFHALPGFLFREPEVCPIFEAVGHGQHIFKAFWEGWHQGGPIRKPVPRPKHCPGPSQRQLDALVQGQPQLHAQTLRGDAWPFPGPPPASRRCPGQRLAREEAEELAAHWRPLTEQGAREVLRRFQEEGGLGRYRGSITRDAGPNKKESRLSPYYRLGLLSMVEVYHTVDRSQPEAQKWLRRSAWRDYAYWMLRYWEQLPERPMRPAYEGLRWSHSADHLEAWKRGRTGFPLVDAGMRELLQTGYLQQNLRHTVGQFLVEVLGISWVEGEAWFHATLADCDAAINAMMWQHQGLTGVSQWLTGVDCHPLRHARKADPDGAYVRRFCPELSRLPSQHLHAPWAAPASVLERAGVRLGETYPHRVVQDPDAEKAAFLSRMRRCRASRPEWLGKGGNDVIERPPGADGRLPAGMRSIFALTERVMKEHEPAQHGKGKGKGKGKQRERWDDDPGGGAGHDGRDGGGAAEGRRVYLAAEDAGDQASSGAHRGGKGGKRGRAAPAAGDCEAEPVAADPPAPRPGRWRRKVTLTPGPGGYPESASGA